MIQTYFSHEGKDFQKNLGSNTASAAKNSKVHDPDSTWSEVTE